MIGPVLIFGNALRQLTNKLNQGKEMHGVSYKQKDLFVPLARSPSIRKLDVARK